MFAITSFDRVYTYADAKVDHIISIGGEDQPMPHISHFKNSFNMYRFVFDDVSDSIYEKAPNNKIILRLLDIYSRININDNVLFHCMAGISRSTAAAFIWLVYNKMSYQDAYQAIVEARGVVQPNLLMIKIADEILNQNGKMLQFVAITSGHEDWLTSSSNK